MSRKASDEAARRLKEAVAESGALTDPARMTDDDIAHVTQAAYDAKEAIDADDGNVAAAIARNR